MEPLIQSIQQDADINGIQISGYHHKSAALAADLLVVLSDPGRGIPAFVRTLELYGNLSNYKINITKSEALSLNISKPEIDKLKKLSLQMANQMLPIYIPKHYLSRINSFFVNYIWNNKRPRINAITLALPKSEGGMGFPDIFKYYKAAMLTRVVDWIRRPPEKLWLPIEEHLAPIPLRSMALLYDYSNLNQLLFNDLTIAILKVWRTEFFKLTPPISPVLMIQDVIGPIPLKPSHGGVPRQLLPIDDFFIEGSMMSFSEFQASNPHLNVTFLHYNRLRDYCYNKKDQLNLFRPLTPFEQLCAQHNPPKKILSRLYKTLIVEKAVAKRAYIGLWERDLNILFTQDQITSIYNKSHGPSQCVKLQESSYKVISRWYRTPSQIHLWHSPTPDKCWRCCADLAKFGIFFTT
ncbi:unnamed protein product [Ranitomeya imitator]|uniref:Maturase n=1 Tax=Ranitomeya imitator TaxID=111125 RepID=A0ABN9LEH6_9NEOB|nr:unnamed protein product [Ranitomeya imitator]